MSEARTGPGDGWEVAVHSSTQPQFTCSRPRPSSGGGTTRPTDRQTRCSRGCPTGSLSEARPGQNHRTNRKALRRDYLIGLQGVKMFLLKYIFNVLPTRPSWLPLQICIGPTIRIGPESWCLPYAGFLYNSMKV